MLSQRPSPLDETPILSLSKYTTFSINSRLTRRQSCAVEVHPQSALLSTSPPCAYCRKLEVLTVYFVRFSNPNGAMEKQQMSFDLTSTGEQCEETLKGQLSSKWKPIDRKLLLKLPEAANVTYELADIALEFRDEKVLVLPGTPEMPKMMIVGLLLALPDVPEANLKPL
ncbi:hypothetical protein NliqN6_5715 [Naganishia liquefaciens]|uniref:Uncharacterized protein n=1 Tax=Naganishia liquefaciens TaxID=104408 RepID=A0A8H3TYS7_9TREE|nr:hypothetical protein NliqN6_5715 [Naganishia liquefaciens]